MSNFLVITSIFPPTQAVHRFSEIEDLNVVVVGDKKSPTEYSCDDVTFLSCNDQAMLQGKLKSVLPYNHYCRKMLGYLYAIKNGASCIVDTDDDNIPNKNWEIPGFSGAFETISGVKDFINIYEFYTDQKIWPRGLPLRLINSKFSDQVSINTESSDVGVWQGLADEDPDVDAIYRLTNGELVQFSPNGSFVLSEGVISPFNSQNTAFRKELFPLLYLPSLVTFRFTDILRSYVAQPIMWAAGFRLGFTEATVRQERNPHDFTKDFESEIPMFLHADEAINLCQNVVRSDLSVSDNLFNCYETLVSSGIVPSEEMTILNAWLEDIA